MRIGKVLFVLNIAALLACQAGTTAANELLDAAQNGDTAAVDRVLKVQPGLLNATDSTGQTALHAAIARKQVAVMESLLKHSADYRVRDAQGRTALALAAQSGSEELATRFLLNIPDVDLPEAVAQGDADYVRLVLLGDRAQIFPDRTIYREYETTYAIFAAAFDHRRFEILKFLLANLPESEGLGERPWPSFKNIVAMQLCCAAGQGRSDVLADYIRAGNDVNVFEEYSSITPLHSAAAAGDLKLVEMLLRAGAKVNADSEGWTVLHSAASNGRREVVEALLAAGAKLDVAQTRDETVAVAPNRIQPPPSSGWRPIHAALWENHLDVVRLLEERGAKIDAWLAAGLGRTEEAKRLIAQLPADPLVDRPSVEGPPPFFWAARCGRLETLKALWTDDSLADVTLQHSSLNLEGYTLLHVAAEAGQTDVMRWLIQHGARLDAATVTGHRCQHLTPLHVAAEAGQIEAVKVLLAAGAGIEDTTEKSSRTMWLAYSGYTPLLVAASAGKKEMVEFLLDHGADIEAAATSRPDYPQAPAPDLDRHADVEAPVRYRVTALSAAAAEGHKDVCELLLARGAKLGGRIGVNPLLAAIGCPQSEIVEFLLQRGADVNTGAAYGQSAVLAALALFLRADSIDQGQKILKLLLDRRPDLKAIKPQQDTSLLLAAVKARNLPLVRSALDLGLLAGEQDFNKLLIEAGNAGNVEIMKLLLAAGSKFAGGQGRIQPDTMKNAFLGAIQCGHKDMVRFLIGQGCNPNPPGPGQVPSPADEHAYGGEPAELAPLVAAVRAGHKLVTIVLLEAGATPSISDSSGSGRALDIAAEAGRADLIRILLAHGATLNPNPNPNVCPQQETTVSKAAERGDIAALDLLLDADAGKTPGAAAAALHGAVFHQHVEMVRRFAARGIDLNLRDQQGRTPLHTALYPWSRYVGVYEWSPLNETAAVLLELGADPNVRDNDGLTPLQVAVVHGRTAFAEKLMAKGARLDVFSAAGLGRIEPVAAALAADPALLSKTLLHGPPLVWAAAAGQAKMVQWLLDHGADPNPARDAKVEILSPLSAAVCGGNRVAVELLLDRGADPSRALTSEDNSHPWGTHSPLHVAAGRGYAEIASLLIDRGANLEPPNRVSSSPYSVSSLSPLPPPQTGSPAPSDLPRTLPVPSPSSVPTIGGFSAERGNFTPFDAAVEGTRDAPDVCDRDPRELPPCRRDLVMLRLLDAYQKQNKRPPYDSFDKALRWAVGEGAFETVKRLLDLGANPNAAGVNEDTPLAEAVWGFRHASDSGAGWAEKRRQCVAVIRLLVAHGADPNRRGYSGSALSVAAERGGDVALVEYLSKAANPAAGP